MIFQKRNLFTFIWYACLSGVGVAIPLLKIDSYYYGRSVFAPLNIVLYNVFSPHGPDLYGTEPMSFYFVNAFLNMGFAFPLALLAFPFTLIAYCLIYMRKGTKINHDISVYPGKNYHVYPGFPSSNCPGNQSSEACSKQGTTWLQAWSGYLPIAYILASLLAWIGVFFTRPHKEERFLFPIYPVISLAAGLCLDANERLWAQFHGQLNALVRRYSSLPTRLLPRFDAGAPQRAYCAMLLVSLCCFLTRNVALYRNYHAPLDIYMAFNEAILRPEFFAFSNASKINFDRSETSNQDHTHTWLSQSITPGLQRVCVGKEWHRFPSSFLLPSPTKVHNPLPHARYRHSAPQTLSLMVTFRLDFVRSEFHGLLPQHFTSPGVVPDATRARRPDMNNVNREEATALVDVSKCDWLVDFTYSDVKPAPREPDYAADAHTWETIREVPFLYAPHSHRLWRAFYVPGLSEKHCKFGRYVLLRRRQEQKRKHTDEPVM